MKKIIVILLVCTLRAYAMTTINTRFSHQVATLKDQTELLELMETAAKTDSDKLVFLPRKFRASHLLHMIEKKRLFIARDQETGEIIGYQKLYLVPPEELDEILIQEIRCKGNERELMLSGSYNFKCKFSEDDQKVDYSQEDLYLYNGSSFTHPDYRQQGVNTELTRYGYEILCKEVQAVIMKKNPGYLVLLYGLVKDNAQKGQDRTIPILKTLIPFLEKVAPEGSQKLEHYRYKAFKPSFDPESETCTPLKDDPSSFGYGCILRYPLLKGTSNEQ